MKRQLLFFSAFLALAGCGSKDAEAPVEVPARADAPEVGKAPTSDEIDEAHGLFVASIGNDVNAGTRLAPLATLQAAILLAAPSGKRVYVCAGRYEEKVVIANGVSVVGGLDCSDPYRWKLGTVRSQIVAPSSPAVVARNVDELTRFEGFDVSAPDGDDTNRSSIALIADHASAFVVANSRLVAGKGRDGKVGKAATQLQPRVTALPGGGGAPAKYTCSNALCMQNDGGYVPPVGGMGGAVTCAGASGHDPSNGASGGTGGVMFYNTVSGSWGPYNGLASENPRPGAASSGAAGANGSDGASGSIGGVSPDGFTPADGTAGTDGEPGVGGRGGNGSVPPSRPLPAAFNFNEIWTGHSGAGGGAGGCPGLAGTPGEGGGASIAALLLESAVVFDAADLVAGDGGTGGMGSFGSDASSGQAAGGASVAASLGTNGGSGGRAGIGGSGGGGPSFAIASSGAAPTVLSTTKLAFGRGGAGVGTKTRTDVVGTRTIPASSAGRAEAQHVF